MLEPGASGRRAVLKLLDAASICVAAFAAEAAFGFSNVPPVFGITLAACGFYLALAQTTGLYRGGLSTLSGDWALTAAATWALALAATWLSAHFMGAPHSLERPALAAWIIATPIIMAAVRVVGSVAARRGAHATRVGLVAPNLRLAGDLIDAIRAEGAALTALYESVDAPFAAVDPRPYWPEIRPVEWLEADARAGHITTVCVLVPGGDQSMRTLIERLSETQTQVVVILDDFAHGLLWHRPLQLGFFAGFSLFDAPFAGVAGVAKRVEDVLLSALALLALAPILLLFAVLVRATSPGPALFKQRRYGLANEPIMVWKFRSMRMEAAAEDFRQAQRDDPRVTPLGGFMRRWSIDELPQLFNVLLGDMSLVGPRPHVEALNLQFEQRVRGYRLRHKVKPGVTGLAQVRGYRGQTDTVEKMARRVRSDVEYIRRWSLGLDIEILIRTLWVVFKRDGAY